MRKKSAPGTNRGGRENIGPSPSIGQLRLPFAFICQNPFGINQGVITDEAALCDIRAGD